MLQFSVRRVGYAQTKHFLITQNSFKMENTNKRLVDAIYASMQIPILQLHERLIEDHQQLLQIVNALREKGLLIIYTMGTWDLFHVGHVRYFLKGEECKGVLIVGIDGDEYIKKTKGPDRPVVPYDERWETVTSQRSVHLATKLETQTANDELVQLIRPDVVVLSFSSAKENFDEYTERMQKKYGPYCGKVEILPRQAETSTSEKIRTVIINGARPLLDFVREHTNALIGRFEEFFKSLEGGKP